MQLMNLIQMKKIKQHKHKLITFCIYTVITLYRIMSLSCFIY